MPNALSPAQISAAFDRPAFVVGTHGKLAYYRFGSGPDVVLVHGWPLSAVTFRAIVPRLAQRFTLHLFDLPGAGLTEWNGRIDVPTDAAALRAAIERLGLSRYALLAHDSGGAIARLVAADAARVTALVLGNTEIPGHRSRLVQAFVAAAQVPGALELLLSTLRFGPIRRSWFGFGRCFRDAAFVDGDFAGVVLRRSFASPRAAAGQIAFGRNIDFALVDRLREIHARITAPVLLVWGTDDPLLPARRRARHARTVRWRGGPRRDPGGEALRARGSSGGVRGARGSVPRREGERSGERSPPAMTPSRAYLCGARPRLCAPPLRALDQTRRFVHPPGPPAARQGGQADGTARQEPHVARTTLVEDFEPWGGIVIYS